MLKNLTKEYFSDLLVRLAHHLSAIEGNKLELSDAVAILIYSLYTKSYVRRCINGLITMNI